MEEGRTFIIQGGDNILFLHLSSVSPMHLLLQISTPQPFRAQVTVEKYCMWGQFQCGV